MILCLFRPASSTASRPMCRDLKTDMCYSGVVMTHIDLLSGIPQGCAPCFAMASDPFVRSYLYRPAFQDTHMFSAPTTADVCHALPLLLRKLFHWSRASGLQLKSCNCIGPAKGASAAQPGAPECRRALP